MLVEQRVCRVMAVAHRRKIGNLRMRRQRNHQGAALLIAVSMLFILLALVIYFYTATRFEWRMASNKRDTVQTQFIADAGLAIAQAYLRNDLEAHPAYTSNDHAWKSFFNGASLARKSWAWPLDNNDDLILPDNPEFLPSGRQGRAVPQVRFEALMRNAQNVRVSHPELSLETLLFDYTIPRQDPNYLDKQGFLDENDLNDLGDIIGTRYTFAADNLLLDKDKKYSFATPELFDPYEDWNAYTNPYLTEAETIHRWADVDTNGDGLRDAVWIPIPIDLPFDSDGIDNDLDGWVDEGPNMGSDGIDNDGDGEIDEFLEGNPPDGLDNDGDGIIDEMPEEDQTNGIDDDGDGDIDGSTQIKEKK